MLFPRNDDGLWFTRVNGRSSRLDNLAVGPEVLIACGARGSESVQQAQRQDTARVGRPDVIRSSYVKLFR